MLTSLPPLRQEASFSTSQISSDLQPVNTHSLSGASPDTLSHCIAVIYTGLLDRRTAHLLNALGGTVVGIDISQTGRVDANLFANCDFVLFSSYSLTMMEQATVIQDVRLGTFAPLVVTTMNHRSPEGEEYVTFVLKAGADAVIFASDPLEGNVARCQALLRRWRQQSQSPTGKNHIHYTRRSPFLSSNRVAGS